ncbi:MAG TPA: hypothetical protein GX715_06980 [Armatimonadetes bacterium]|jgi:alpha-L-fucosidase 2|nr:hypothetical protein [Armatimonadota bacterium]
MGRTHRWEFPLPRTHTGVLLGNGTLGALVWGTGSELRITLGRADHWDHRGGMPWTEKTSYRAIRDCLERGDEPRLRALFEQIEEREGEPRRPTVLPVGRVDLHLGEGATLQSATLEMERGELVVMVEKAGEACVLRVVMAMDRPVLLLLLPDALKDARARSVPAWEYVGEELKKLSYEPPVVLEGWEIAGWVQACPADPALCAGYRQEGSILSIAVERGESVAAARDRAARRVADALARGYREEAEASRLWWQAYWDSVPRVEIPNETLSFLYDYGMYKFAAFTNPDGVPATLQGAWVEEYRLPPWSNDYHFNINVQLCYQPAYHGNRLENLRPLFQMIDSWREVLRHNARVFVGIDDGVMLPHAVDDRCTCMGGFWTGSIDHGCTAWVALMMYRYYRYTLDRDFLRETAYPFMHGAMRVYEEMLEREGERLLLPVSVSPEYRGAQMNAWGRNASFQLAAIHALCEALEQAAADLGEEPRPIWREIRERLPRACLMDGQIILWEGTPLEESHRHHSHLAGITPFDILDLEDPVWRGHIERSLRHWILMGPGLWSGWCVPWASMIHSRVGNAEAAELLLEVFDRFYTNEGHGTLHDAAAAGFSLMGMPAIQGPPSRPDLMQMDGGMGAVAAVQEMLLHTRRGVNYLFAGAPARWKRVSFEGMRTDGAFLVSALREKGVVEHVTVESEAGGVFRVRNPWPGAARIRRSSGEERVEGMLLEIPMHPGERVVLAPTG